MLSNAEGAIKVINLEALEQEASDKIDKGAFGYVQGGAEDELTLRANIESFNKKQIIPNGLTGLDGADTTVTFLGAELASPIIIAPMAAHGLLHEVADKATITGAGKARTMMGVSTYASVMLDQISAASPDTPWFFQLYMSRDNGFNEHMISKAIKAGVKAIVLTIDAGVPGNRESDKKNNYTYSMATPNVAEYYEGKSITHSEARAMRKISFTAEDIQYIKSISGGLPVFVKGIQAPEAAEVAVQAGADGIWASSHGGRQMDGSPSSFDMLPLIAKQVNKRVPIIFDSGIRRGSHVFKALASGADIIAVGRPVLYGLILGGSEGVKAVFDQLNYELHTTMILAGKKNIDEVKATQLFDVATQQIEK